MTEPNDLTTVEKALVRFTEVEKALVRFAEEIDELSERLDRIEKILGEPNGLGLADRVHRLEVLADAQLATLQLYMGRREGAYGPDTGNR